MSAWMFFKRVLMIARTVVRLLCGLPVFRRDRVVWVVVYSTLGGTGPDTGCSEQMRYYRERMRGGTSSTASKIRELTSV